MQRVLLHGPQNGKEMPGGGRMPGVGKRFQAGNPGGPGRPRRPGRDYLRVLAEELTPERWRNVVRKAIEQAEQGDTDARAWLSQQALEAPCEPGLPRPKAKAHVKESAPREQGNAGPGGDPGGAPLVPPPRSDGEGTPTPTPGQPGGAQTASAGNVAGTGAGGQRPGAAGAAAPPTGGTAAEPEVWRGLFGRS